MTRVPSFVSPLPWPETNIRVSVIVCQCQGMTDLVAVLASSRKAPFVGSPLRTEAFMQVGRPGRFTNLSVALAAYIALPASSACADLSVGPATRTANTRLRATKRMYSLLG